MESRLNGPLATSHAKRREHTESILARLWEHFGAVVFYLRVISWQIEGFTPALYLDPLRAMDAIIRRDGMLVVSEHRFLIEAQKA
jgi:hypothetical protein